MFEWEQTEKLWIQLYYNLMKMKWKCFIGFLMARKSRQQESFSLKKK